MHYITKRIPKLAGLAFAAFLAACSADNSTSPTTAKKDPAVDVVAPALPSVVMEQAAVAKEVPTPAPTGGHSTLAAIYPSNAQTYQFTIDPNYSWKVIFGTHIVTFPNNTICDPATSSYGPSAWMNNCYKLRQPITITATTWTDANGRPQIDFANAIRFYPNFWGELPAIYLKDAWASSSSWSRIDYCVSAGNCVNEAATDPTLATRRDLITGYLYRLIRHFSGYNVWA